MTTKEESKNSGFEEKVLFVNRCSKVIKGGRKFSFSALVLVGDGKGKIGFAIAKANELSDSIRKGGELARKNMIDFERVDGTLPHQIEMTWDGSRVILKPAKIGTGVIAGSCIRSILEMAGLTDVVAKLYGSNNRVNQVRATFKALQMLRNKEKHKKLRGIAA